MNINPNLNIDWVNNPDLTESDLMGISENCGYDILIGANNGEDVRRAFQTKPWLNDQEINSIEPEDEEGGDDPEPEPTPEPEPIGPKCLTFTAGEGGASIGFVVYDSYGPPEEYTKPSLQYSTDAGNTWQDYNLLTTTILRTASVIELAEDESVMFRGVNEYLSYYDDVDFRWLSLKTYINGNVSASGDVTSLLNGVGGEAVIPKGCYYSMFSNCTGLTHAPELPATKLSYECYGYMFSGCTSLTVPRNCPPPRR